MEQMFHNKKDNYVQHQKKAEEDVHLSFQNCLMFVFLKKKKLPSSSLKAKHHCTFSVPA